MKEKVLAYIRQCEMTAPGDRVIVALSGGADSLCLLNVLHELSGVLSISLRAVHVHHGLRGAEADRDAGFAEEICERLGIPCTVRREDVAGIARRLGVSTEEAGRMARYRCLQEEASLYQAARIAVAHHGDDSAETILFNLFRGSGLKGLGGIVPVRENIIRPLLLVSRNEILEYLKENGLEYCEDSTNKGNDYTRNRIRNQLLPSIVSGINEGAVEHILAAGRLIGEADAYLEEQAEKFLEEHGSFTVAGDRPGNVPGNLSAGIAIPALLKEPPILRSYVVKAMMKAVRGSLKDITSAHITHVCGLLEKQTGRGINLPCGVAASRDYEKLWIRRIKKADNVESEPQNPAVFFTFAVFSWEKGREIPKNQYTKWFDYDKIKDTLSVRYRRTGDYITLASGGKKTVKSYMIDEKIPARCRKTIPLLADGSHVLWIVGHRISEYYKITENTKTILQVRFDKGDTYG